MVNTLMGITSVEFVAGAIMYAIAWIEPVWLEDKSGLWRDAFVMAALFLLAASLHNLVALGIYGLSLLWTLI